jgi:hypothetical protein
MSSWTKVRRAMGGSDPRHWRVPGFLEMHLRGDHGRRVLFAMGVGVGIAAPLAAFMLAIAPPDEVLKAILLGVLFALAVGALAFMYQDGVQIIISLQDDGLRRQYRPMLINPLGWRDRDEFWSYDSMRGCAIVPLDQLNGKYSLLAIVVPDQTLAIIVPRRVDIKQVASFLASQNLQVKAVKELPSQARPQPSVGRRGMVRSAILAIVGVLLIAAGGVARLAIYGEDQEMDPAAVAAAVEAAPEGTVVRECLGVDQGGVKQARIAPDGSWIWALSRGKEGSHQVWNDQQAEPIGSLDLPAAYACHAAFTPDSRYLVITTDREAFVWQLEPLEQTQQFSLEVTPDDIAITADGSQLIATMISSVRSYDLATGQSAAAMPITSGALVDTELSADGGSLIVAQQQRVLRVELDGGAVEELLAYPSPQRVHLSGRLAPGGTWAAMQSKLGTVLYDLTARNKVSIIAAGPMSNRPVISSDGRRMALGTRSGVGVWDTTAKTPLVRLVLNSSTQVDLSSDGRTLLGYSYRAAKMVVWEMPD